MEEIEDQEQFHMVHVSEGHFDCLQCHDEIKHGIHHMEQQLLASGNCGTCHSGDRHSLQEKIYAGVAFSDLKPMPSGKYTAGVACDGCHTDVKADKGPGAMPFTKKVADCATCHEKSKAAENLEMWRDETNDALASLKPKLADLEEKIRSAPAGAEGLTEAKALFDSAKRKFSYVRDDRSFGAHNFDYIESALLKATRQINEALSLVAKWKEPAGEEGQE